MKSNNNNNNDDDDDGDNNNNNNNNTAMGSVHARGDTFLTFGLKALTDTNTSRLATAFLAAFCTASSALKTLVTTNSFRFTSFSKTLNKFNTPCILKVGAFS
jgi:hypothetical protein